MAIIVENGQHGGSTAGPIARKVMDYYLLGKLPAPDKVLEEIRKPLNSVTNKLANKPVNNAKKLNPPPAIPPEEELHD